MSPAEKDIWKEACTVFKKSENYDIMRRVKGEGFQRELGQKMPRVHSLKPPPAAAKDIETPKGLAQHEDAVDRHVRGEH